MSWNGAVDGSRSTEYRHVTARDGCGGLAFFVRSDVGPGSIVYASDVVLPDGEHPTPHTPIVCGSCGALLPLNALVTPRGRARVDI